MLELLGSLDWGTVPAWLGGLSLFLAFRIFRTDRVSGERAQVDSLGVWLKCQAHPTVAVAGQIETFVKNASNLPLSIVRLEYDVTTDWLIVDAEIFRITGLRSGFAVAGIGAERQYISIGPIEPDNQTSYTHAVSLEQQRPQPDAQLDGPRPVRAQNIRMLVVDNAGRRWIVRPSKGLARRVHWYSLLSERQKSLFHPWARPVNNFVGYWRRVGVRGIRLTAIREKRWRVPQEHRDHHNIS